MTQTLTGDMYQESHQRRLVESHCQAARLICIFSASLLSYDT